MNFHDVVGWMMPPLLAPKEYPPHHSLFLDLIQSPLNASDIGLIHFCLDFVLFCHDTSPDLAMWTLAAEACGAADPFEGTSRTHWDSTNHHVLHLLMDKADRFRFSPPMQLCCEPQHHKFTPSVWKRSDHRRKSLKNPLSRAPVMILTHKRKAVPESIETEMLGLKHIVAQKNPQHIEN